MAMFQERTECEGQITVNSGVKEMALQKLWYFGNVGDKYKGTWGSLTT